MFLTCSICAESCNKNFFHNPTLFVLKSNSYIFVLNWQLEWNLNGRKNTKTLHCELSEMYVCTPINHDLEFLQNCFPYDICRIFSPPKKIRWKWCFVSRVKILLTFMQNSKVARGSWVHLIWDTLSMKITNGCLA